MCDYSLEHYQSRPAQQGETYTLTRFPSGSIGFIARDTPSVAVCMACDMKLKLANLPDHVQSRFGIQATDVATFTQVDGGLYRDGIRFSNGRVALLQELGPGVSASLYDALSRPIESLKPETELVG